MNDNDSDIGEDETEELHESDMDEVIEDLLDVEGDHEDSGSEAELFKNDPGNSDRKSPIRDDSDFVFEKHTGPVFCCSLEPKNGNIAVTGGEDDKAYVWETQQGQVLLECQGHKDSVTMASFNYDGTYVATGDMSGLVKVWKLATKELTWSDSVDDLSWLRWHHGMNALLCATTSGDVFMWRIPSGECKVIPGHSVTTDCGVIMPDGRRLAVGYADGVIKVLELKSGQVQGSLTSGEVHSLSVSCMDSHFDNNIIASGGGDGRVSVIKTQPFKVVWVFDCPVAEDNSPPFVEALSFNKDPSLSLLAAGTLTGKLYILDFGKQMLRHQCHQQAGICRVLWDRHSPTVYVGGLDGAVHIYDGRSGSLTSQLLGHREAVLDISLSLDGNTLLSSSDDMTCRVYAISPPER